MNNFLRFIPICRPLPLRTFPVRLIRKWVYQAHRSYLVVGSFLGLFGAKFYNETENGNTQLRLNKGGALGKKGFILEVPKDEVIFEFVRFRAEWELNEARFLSDGLNFLRQNCVKDICILDIGANVGLVTLEILNLVEEGASAICIEPVSEHYQALNYNLRDHKNRVKSYNVALGILNEKKAINIQKINRGNSTLVSNRIFGDEYISQEIEILNTENFCNMELENYSGFVLKSDTQGMDEQILARIPLKVWNLTQCCVIEVWSHSQVSESDVRKLQELWAGFFMSWDVMENV